MNLQDMYNTKELKLIEDAGIMIENRDYSNEELERVGYQIEEYIMNHSSKNNVISNLFNQYEGILNTFIKKKVK